MLLHVRSGGPGGEGEGGSGGGGDGAAGEEWQACTKYSAAVSAEATSRSTTDTIVAQPG